MRHFFIACCLITRGGCAGFSGSNLVPGVATEADAERVMGPSVDRRERKDGEVVRYYSRLPAGRAMYAARFGSDGKLIAIEQRLTRGFAKQLIPGESPKEDARALIGPPYRTQAYPAAPSQVWRYPMNDGAV